MKGGPCKRPLAPLTAQGAQGKHRSQALRSSVMLQCQEALTDRSFCACLTRQLELLSPDPDTEFTDQDLETGLDTCREHQAQVGEL